MTTSTSAGDSRASFSPRALQSRALRTCMAHYRAALQLRDEQRLLDLRVESADQVAWSAVLGQSDGAEALARQLLKPPLGQSDGLCVGNIEFMPRVARAIHNDLDTHVTLLLGQS